MTNKLKIILASIFVVTFAILLLHLLGKEPEVELIDPEREVSVRNLTEYDNLDYDAAVKAGLQVLNLEHIFVTIKPMDPNIKKRFSWQQGGDLEAIMVHGKEGLGQYNIYIEDLPRAKAIDVIAHELIHIQQVEEGRLEILEGNRVKWDGRVYYTSSVPYDKRPWEIGAMTKDHHLGIKIDLMIALTAEHYDGLREDYQIRRHGE